MRNLTLKDFEIHNLIYLFLEIHQVIIKLLLFLNYICIFIVTIVYYFTFN